MLCLLPRIDIVLLSGDIADMPMDVNADQKENEKYHGHLDQVVGTFTAINSNIYYIPGNVRPNSLAHFM